MTFISCYYFYASLPFLQSAVRTCNIIADSTMTKSAYVLITFVTFCFDKRVNFIVGRNYVIICLKTHFLVYSKLPAIEAAVADFITSSTGFGYLRGSTSLSPGFGSVTSSLITNNYVTVYAFLCKSEPALHLSFGQNNSYSPNRVFFI